MNAVEALKDQAGLCRWNYVLRSLQQPAKDNSIVSLQQPAKDNSIGSLSQAKRTSSSINTRRRGWQAADEKAKQSKEALRTVVYLSCG
ncbi:hypothetical protein BHE74_00056173, partial [Ensete ventricosum]